MKKGSTITYGSVLAISLFVLFFTNAILRDIIISIIVKDALVVEHKSFGLFLGILPIAAIFIIIVMDNLENKKPNINAQTLVFVLSLLVSFFSLFCFDAANFEKIYTYSLFVHKKFLWKQIRKIELDIDENNDRCFLVYRVKLPDSSDVCFTFNDNKNDLNKLDRFLSKRNIEFDLKKIKNNSQSIILYSKEKEIVERHLKNH